jgi:hypothetical protein
MRQGKRLLLLTLELSFWWALASWARARAETLIDPLALPASLGPSAPDGSVARPASVLAPICTDRPTKSFAPCTVDAGHWQVESDLINVSYQRESGVTTDTVFVTNPTLKYGLSKVLDLELNLAPYEIVRTQRAGAPTTELGGVGDLYLRLKYAPYASADGRLTFAVLPYLKAPTARLGLGDGAVEGGALATVSYKFTDKLILLLVPEGDNLKDNADVGRHLAASQIVNIGYVLPHNLEVYAEVWASWNFDPKGLVREDSADIALQWGVTNDFQLDCGFNLGLNHQTPGLQTYVGLSRRF